MLFDIFTRDGLLNFLYSLPALLISLSIHELAHAFVAYKLGDESQKYRGRLTLDPLAHIDWFGFISIVLVGFGWGKPVIVNDDKFKNKSRDNMLVSLAGPMSNLILAFVFALVLKLLIVLNVVTTGDLSSSTNILVNLMYTAILFNVIFAVFNMLPIPPFDGSKVLLYFLPYRSKQFVYKMEQYSLLIIVILFATGISSYIISPIIIFLMRIINSIL